MAALIRPHHLGLIIDRHGIVVMSNRQDMVLRSLWPLSDAITEKLIASRQFGDGPFVPILPQTPVDRGEYLLQGERLLVLHQPLPWEDWALVILGSMRSIAQARLFGIGATLLFYLLLIGFFTIIVIIREGEERLRHRLKMPPISSSCITREE